jgi:DNA-binding transcriptional regulator YiaG
MENMPGREGRWDADAVRALRRRLGLTQAELAERLGTRQQTVSEWETGASRPRGMSQRLLRMVAEESAAYDASAPGEAPGEAAGEAP